MTKHELERLAERYQAKADEPYYTYQETGLTRYNTARRNNEDLADAMRMAAAARDDHAALIQLRGTVADLAAMAERIPYVAEDMKVKEMESLVKSVISAAREHGVKAR